MSSSVPADQAYSQSDASHANAGRDRPAPKTKKCRICHRPYEPRNTLQMCCSPSCAIQYAKYSGEKRQSAAMKRVAMAEKRERKAALKSRKDWLREAQAVFNAMIRERDFFKPCISCGVRIMTIENGGAWDAGHYRSVGAAPELRFETSNVHKQCKSCNSGVIRQGSRVLVAHDAERYASIHARYRLNLIDRIGLQQVEWLESYHEPLHPSAEWLREKIREWRAETRRMRESRESRAA